jgi:hypothetical protein
MSDYKNEYQKFADSAVRGREKDDAMGRLRLSVFLGVAGGLACFLLKALDMIPPHKYIAYAIIGSAPLAVVLLIVNFIRTPNEYKASAPVLLMGLVTLVGAGATIALANILGVTKAFGP